jgi:multisubunit Na+/H+ antiporter MnhE subunit
VAIGIAISAGCLLFCGKFLPLPKISGVKPFRFIVYLLFLFGQVCMAGLFAIKFILTDARVEIVEVKTKISNRFLRSVLASSVTLVPGSVSLELNGDAITVLWLTKAAADPKHIDNAGELIIGKLEKMLLKVQK